MNYLTFVLACYLASILTFKNISDICSDILSCVLAGIYSDNLSCILSDILSGIWLRSSSAYWNLALAIDLGPNEVRVHRDGGILSIALPAHAALAVEKCKLKAGRLAVKWPPLLENFEKDARHAFKFTFLFLISTGGRAVPTVIWRSLKGSGSAHCDQELAVAKWGGSNSDTLGTLTWQVRKHVCHLNQPTQLRLEIW